MNKESIEHSIRQIKKSLKILRIKANFHQINLWIKHLLLLQKWNQAYNLTSITHFKAMLIKHLFDSLSIAPFIKGKLIIDLGTGAGFPGIPLSILMPNKKYILIESVTKKVNFLCHVKRTLKLNNIKIINTRIQDYNIKIQYDHIICRAFSSVKNIYNLSQHYLKKNGSFLIMKGTDIEKNQLYFLSPDQYKFIKLDVPNLSSERHLVIISTPK